MSLDYMGYIGGVYGTLDGMLFTFGQYFSKTFLFSAFCASLFVYSKKKVKKVHKNKINKN